MDARERVAQLEALLADDPADRDLYFLLGKALLDAGRHDEAAVRLAEAVRLNPEHAPIRRFWGEALRDAGRIEEAAAVWSEGIAVAERMGEIQSGKEMRALLKRLERAGGTGEH